MYIYIKGHVETVDTKDQSNAIVYWVWYVFCRHCRYIHWCLWLLHNTLCRCENICIKWPLAPAKREGYCIVWAFHLGGLAVHQSVRGGSFVNFLGLVKLQGWLQARRTANPQFLKLKGAQQPGNSYISMGTKLHPPHSNWDLATNK